MTIFLTIAYGIGLFFAAKAVLNYRTPQGATAWILFLILFPFLSVPLYLLFGQSRYEGYNNRRKFLSAKVQNEFDTLKAMNAEYFPSGDEMKLLSYLGSMSNQPGFTVKNKIQLLLNAQEAFPEMQEEIKKAQSYIVFQFYIIRPDEIGMTFIDLLVQKAKEGVKVTFMNDAIGVEIPKKILNRMHEAGIQTGTFNQSTGKGKLQINFRNHRKIIVVDGRVAFIGGLNIGDEYTGAVKKFGFWRDTHVRLEGPSVIAAQLSSAKDWYCIHERPMAAKWNIHPTDGHSTVMVLDTGPADDKQSCLLSHLSLINSATKRIWIANPYYVPPESLMDAILLASLRGVDVRILLPSYSDSKSVLLASEVYQKKLLRHGVKVYRYTEGFLHEKVMLIDDSFGLVGSANLDCRSMFINFEISVITTDGPFLSDMEKMLAEDYRVSQLLTLSDFENIPLLHKMATGAANLLAPIL